MKRISVSQADGLNKIRGLIGKKPQAIFFCTRFGIHTFGVSYPIDVVILDKANKIQVVKKSLKPNSFFFWNPRYDRVLELPVGTIAAVKLRVGEQIELTIT